MPEIHCVCMLIHQFCQIKKKKKSQDQRGLDLSFIDTLEETHSAHAFSQSQLNITKTMLSFTSIKTLVWSRWFLVRLPTDGVQTKEQRVLNPWYSRVTERGGDTGTLWGIIGILVFITPRGGGGGHKNFLTDRCRMWENIKPGVVWSLTDTQVLRSSPNGSGVGGKVGVVVSLGNFVVEIYFTTKAGEGRGS